MKTIVTIKPLKTVALMLVMLITFVLQSNAARAQSGITVSSIQNLNFGAFTQNSNGGTVQISTSGSRTVTGSVVPLNFGIQWSPAIFEVEAPIGTTISSYDAPDFTFKSSTGGTMTAHVNNIEPALPFITTVSRTQFKVAATLTVDNNAVAPPGSYSSTLDITFVNQ